MKTSSIVILSLTGIGAVVGVGAYLWYKKQVNLLKNELQYKVLAVRAKELSSAKVVLDITVRITSKSTIEAKVKDMYIELFVDGNKFGVIENAKFKGIDGKERDYFILPAKGFSDVTLQLTFIPKLVVGAALNTAISFITGKDIPVKLVGHINVQSAFVSVSVPFTYDTTVRELMAPAPVVNKT